MCSSTWAVLPISSIICRCVIISIGLPSNILLVFGLIMDPLQCFRNSSSYLIANLAVTDILSCFPWFLIEYWRPCLNGWYYPLIHLPPYISCSSIFTMALDRFMACVYPLKYRILINGKVTFALILLQWSLCFGHLVLEKYVDWSTYSRSTIAFCTLISAAIMYGKAAHVLKNNTKYLKNVAGVSSTTLNRTGHTRLDNAKRFMTTMFLVSFITITTLAPKMTYEFVTGEKDSNSKHSSVSHFGSVGDPFSLWLTTLLYVNFSINPFLYIWRLKNYRRTFKIMIKR